MKGVVFSWFSILTLWACQGSLQLLCVIKHFSIPFQWLFEKNKVEQCFPTFILLPGYNGNGYHSFISTNPVNKALSSDFMHIPVSGRGTGNVADLNPSPHSYHLEKSYIWKKLAVKERQNDNEDDLLSQFLYKENLKRFLTVVRYLLIMTWKFISKTRQYLNFGEFILKTNFFTYIHIRYLSLKSHSYLIFST